MGKRKKTPEGTEDEVLLRSRRRCCLCFGLNRDDSEKHEGQIAHLDRDPSNYDPDNLAYLCLDHHARYDSRSQQSKGITVGEAKTHRDQLYKHIEQLPQQPSAEGRPAQDQRRDINVEITHHRPDGKTQAPSYYEMVLPRARQKRVGTLFEFNFRVINRDRRSATVHNVRVVAEAGGVTLDAVEPYAERYVQTAGTQFGLRPISLVQPGVSPKIDGESVSKPFRIARATKQVVDSLPVELNAMVIFTFLHGQSVQAECRFTRRQ